MTPSLSIGTGGEMCTRIDLIDDNNGGVKNTPLNPLKEKKMEIDINFTLYIDEDSIIDDFVISEKPSVTIKDVIKYFRHGTQPDYDLSDLDLYEHAKDAIDNDMNSIVSNAIEELKARLDEIDIFDKILDAIEEE